MLKRRVKGLNKHSILSYTLEEKAHREGYALLIRETSC
jgi:hypothetical protein